MNKTETTQRRTKGKQQQGIIYNIYNPQKCKWSPLAWLPHRKKKDKSCAIRDLLLRYDSAHCIL